MVNGCDYVRVLDGLPTILRRGLIVVSLLFVGVLFVVCGCCGFLTWSHPPIQFLQDPMSTCRKIVNWKKTLVFPDEAHISSDAKDLILKLICEPSKRLSFDQIKKHPFFKSVNWEQMHDGKPPIVPKVVSDVDTENFDKFEIQPISSTDDDTVASDSFIGYTFKRPEPRAKMDSMFMDPTPEENPEAQ